MNLNSKQLEKNFNSLYFGHWSDIFKFIFVVTFERQDKWLDIQENEKVDELYFETKD